MKMGKNLTVILFSLCSHGITNNKFVQSLQKYEFLEQMVESIRIELGKAGRKDDKL